MICECCGGRGMIIDRINGRWINCPKCQSILNEVKNSSNIEEQLVTVDILDTLRIPDVYKRVKYSETLISSHDSEYVSGDLTYLKNTLSKIMSDLTYGELPKLSYYIHCPPVIDINVWVYTLQRLAISKNISTVPYITINELATYIDDSGYKPEYVNYINAHLCVLDISARLTTVAANTLADLLNVRAKKGLPTICTGYWGTDSIKNGSSTVRYLITTDEYRLNILFGNTVHFKSGRFKTDITKVSQPKVSDDVLEEASNLI